MLETASTLQNIQQGFANLEREISEGNWPSDRAAKALSDFAREHASDYENERDPKAKDQMYRVIMRALLTARDFQEPNL